MSCFTNDASCERIIYAVVSHLNFLAARWLDDGWRLDLLGVECKGETNSAEVWKITSEQLRRYARCVPVLYFACSVPRESRIAEFEALCNIAGVPPELRGRVAEDVLHSTVESSEPPLGYDRQWIVRAAMVCKG